MRKTILLMACCLLGWGAHLFAQQDAVSSGGTASGTGGSVTYTVGEANYINTTSANGTITQGVQQPWEIFLLTGINEKNIAADITLFPNPTLNYIILSVTNGNTEDLLYQLFDMNGKKLEEKRLDGTQTNINMADYANAAYFIKVTNSKNESKEFKVIKN